MIEDVEGVAAQFQLEAVFPPDVEALGQSGIEVSEIFPHLATCVDELAVVRSMVANFTEHANANLFLHTGSNQQGKPSLGSWVTYGLGSENQDLPGYNVFRNGVNPEAPIIAAEAVWQYSHHVLAGLISHRGPICTVANWSGQWPGLVGMLNLNGSLTKAGVKYATLWSEDFSQDAFGEKLGDWLKNGKVSVERSLAQGWLNGEDECTTWDAREGSRR